MRSRDGAASPEGLGTDLAVEGRRLGQQQRAEELRLDAGGAQEGARLDVDVFGLQHVAALVQPEDVGARLVEQRRPFQNGAGGSFPQRRHRLAADAGPRHGHHLVLGRHLAGHLELVDAVARRSDQELRRRMDQPQDRRTVARIGQVQLDSLTSAVNAFQNNRKKARHGTFGGGKRERSKELACGAAFA